MSKSFKKYTALAALFFYCISGQGLPTAFANAGSPQKALLTTDVVLDALPINLDAAQLLSARGTGARQIARAPLTLPADLGLIEEFQPGSSSTKLPSILHLQTAHGDHEAQMALARVLNYLKKNREFDLLLLEGADDQLAPEVDRFFKEAAWNQQVAKERLKTGRMSGAAYFLMNQTDDEVKAFGVESAKSYRQNRRDFSALIQKREALELFLKSMESDADLLFSEKAAKSLLELRRQERAFREGRLDWMSWMDKLKREALSSLSLDLEHVSSQKAWPALLRFFRLRSMEPSAKNTEAPLETAGLWKPVAEILKKAQSGGRFRYGEVRLVLEEWLSRKNTKRSGLLSPEVKKALQRTALESEIRPEALLRETEVLTGQLMDFYAKTEAEKELLRLDSDLKLLRRLLLTELSFQDYLLVLNRAETLLPSRLLQTLQRLGLKNLSLTSVVPDPEFKTALRFYRGAKQREKKIAENVFKLAGQNQAPWVVLVTGGFHGAGLREEFVNRDMTYLRVTPQNSVKNGEDFTAVPQDPRAIYRQVFLEHSLGKEALAQIEDAAVLPISSRAALNRLGVTEAGFLANRTAVLKQWLAVGSRINPTEAVQQFNASRFALRYGLRWTRAEDRSSAFVRSEMRASARVPDVHKQIYRELRRMEEVLHHLPQGNIPKFSKIQVLLAVLYGGTVQLHAEQSRFMRPIKQRRLSWEKRVYDFRWGLYALTNKANLNKLSPEQRKKALTYQAEAVAQLAQMDIRVEDRISSVAAKGELSIGAVLTRAPAFQNPFLQTFLGETAKVKSATVSQSRLERAVEILTGYSSGKERKLTPAEASYLRSFDTIFIPDFRMDHEAPFIVRVQHNGVRGPYKGGIRLVDAFTLINDKHFKGLFDDLKTKLNLEELRYFLRKYILEETLPLSFGMTSKAAVANLPYGGGKGTMLAAEVFETSPGTMTIADLHGGHDAPAYLFQLARGTARVFAESSIVQSNRDIPAADLNSGRYMDAMADEQIETVYEKLRAKLEALARQRGKRFPPEDAALIQAFAAVPSYTKESIETPFYLKELTDYAAQLRRSGRKIPTWAKPFFEAAAAYTSKSEKWMGSAFRVESTGYGGIHVLKELIVREGLSRSSEQPLLGMTVKLMGLGNVGAPAAEKMIEEGMTIKMISLGPLGAIYKADGGLTRSEIEQVRKMLAEKKNLALLGKAGYEAPGVEYIVPAQVDKHLLELDTDVFVLAAVENAVHAGNVGLARGKIFLELANGAITNEAYDRLVQDSNTMVIPDTLANAGGVTVSYYEWLQNLKNERWAREDVIRRLEKQLSGGVDRVAKIRATYATDWRTAADILMILEVLDARRAERSRSVRSKKSQRSEMRSVNDQIGGFSYLDSIQNGKVGVYPASEIARQVTEYLQDAGTAKGIFAAAVLAKGEDREIPDYVHWQPLVNVKGAFDPERLAVFIREKVQPLAARQGMSFEVHRFLYTVRADSEDAGEMIQKLGGQATGLLLAVFPEKTGGGSDAPGGRGQRPWDQPTPFSPRGGMALEAETPEGSPKSYFSGQTESAEEHELVVTPGRSEVRTAGEKSIVLPGSAAEFDKNPFPAFPLLSAWFSEQRWFMEKGKDILGVDYGDAFILGEENGSTVHGVIAQFRFRDSEGQTFSKKYFIPVIVSRTPALGSDTAEAVEVKLTDGTRTLALAEHQSLYQKLLIHFFRNPRAIPTWNQGQIIFNSFDSMNAGLDPDELQSRPLGVSTSNVLTRVESAGKTVVSKTYKDLRGASGQGNRVWPANEELPKYTALARAGYTHMPGLHGSMEYVTSSGERVTLGVIMEALQVETEAGGVFWNGLARLMEAVKAEPSNVLPLSVGPLKGASAFARDLAGTVAGMHAAFLKSGQPGYSAVPVSEQDRLKWQRFTGHHLSDALTAMDKRAAAEPQDSVLHQLSKAFDARRAELKSAEHALDPLADLVMKAPVHGDLSTAQGLLTAEPGESLSQRFLEAAGSAQDEAISEQAAVLAEHIRWLDFEGPPAKDPVSPSADSRESWLKDAAGVLGGFWYIANLQLFNYLGLDPRTKPEHREEARKASLILAGQADVSELAHLGLTPDIVNVLNQWVSETTDAFLDGYFQALEKEGVENAVLTRWNRQTAKSLVAYFLLERAFHEFSYEFYAREWGWEAIPGGRILQILDSGRLAQITAETTTDQRGVQTAFGGTFESVPELAPREFFSPVDAGLPVDGVLLPFHHLRHADDWGVGNFYTAKLAGDFLHAMDYRVTQDLPYTYSSAGFSPYSVLSRLLLDPEYLSAPEALRMLERAGIPAAGWAQFLSDHADQIKKLKESPDILHHEIRELNAQAMRLLWEAFQKYPESPLAREFQTFLDKNKEMVEDDLLFLQLTREFGENWRRWPQGVRERQEAALTVERERLKPALRFEAFVQFVLERQRQERDDYYKSLGISTMVDMAIAPPDVEVWKNPAAVGMSYDNGLIRSAVQGVPGKKEARVGQLWNFSMYQWLKPEAQALFLKIFETNLERADYLRIDQTLAIYRIFGFLSKGLPLKALGIFEEVESLRRSALAEGTSSAKQTAGRQVRDLIQKSVREKAVSLGWPEETIQFLFEESGQVRSNGNLLMIARKTPRELHHVKIENGMPWQRWHWEEDDFLQGEPKWDVLRLTPNQRAQDDGFTETWLFPEDGSEPPTADDEIRAGYFMPSPGESMMLELARIAQEKGKVLILETLGTVTAEIQRSSARFGNNYFPIVYAMGDPSSWYYPPNFKSASGMVTFDVADTGSLKGSWQGMKDWNVKGSLVRTFFPDLPGEQFQPHMLDVTPEVHQKLLQMVYAPWNVFPGLDPAKVPLIALLGLIDLANLPEKYRLNIPGQQDQWIHRLPEELSLENLLHAARGEPSSELAALAVRSVRELQKQRERAYPPVNPSKVKILRVKPDVNEAGILMRQLHPEGADKTPPFLIEASVQGVPQRMEAVLRAEDGRQARFTMQEREPERGAVKDISVWALGLKPSKPGAYDFWIELTQPSGQVQKSGEGRLVTAPENAELNPVSPDYALTADGRHFAARSEVRVPTREVTVNTLTNVQDVLKEIGISELQVFIFGSYADDRTRDGSDLDLILMVREGTPQSRAVELIRQFDTIQKDLTVRLQAKGHRELEWHDINPATRDNYLELWKKRDFFTRNRHLWFVSPEAIDGYFWNGGDSTPITLEGYQEARRRTKESEASALSQEIARLQQDLRSALEFAQNREGSEDFLTVEDDVYQVFQGTPIEPSDEAPLAHLGQLDDFLERQKAAVFSMELYEKLAGLSDAHTQEFRASLALIESQIERFQGFLGRSETRTIQDFLKQSETLPDPLPRAMRQWANRLYLEGKGHPKRFNDAGFKKLKGVEAAEYQMDRVGHTIKDALRSPTVHYDEVVKIIVPLFAQVSGLTDVSRQTREDARILSKYPTTLIWLLHSLYASKRSEFVLAAALHQDAELRSRAEEEADAWGTTQWEPYLGDATVEIPARRSWTWAEARQSVHRLPGYLGRKLWHAGPALGRWVAAPLRAFRSTASLSWSVLTNGWFWQIGVWTGLPLGFGYGVYRWYLYFMDSVTAGHPENASEFAKILNHGFFALTLIIPILLLTAVLLNLRVHSWFPGGARTSLGAPPVKRLSAGELKDRGQTGGTGRVRLDESEDSPRSEVRLITPENLAGWIERVENVQGQRSETQDLSVLIEEIKTKLRPEERLFFEKAWAEDFSSSVRLKNISEDERLWIYTFLAFSAAVLSSQDPELEDLRRLDALIQRWNHQVDPRKWNFSLTLFMQLVTNSAAMGDALKGMMRLSGRGSRLPGEYRYKMAAFTLYLLGMHVHSSLLTSNGFNEIGVDFNPKRSLDIAAATLRSEQFSEDVPAELRQELLLGLKVGLTHFITGSAGAWSQASNRRLNMAPMGTIEPKDLSKLWPLQDFIVLNRDLLVKTVEEIRVQSQRTGFSYLGSHTPWLFENILAPGQFEEVPSVTWDRILLNGFEPTARVLYFQFMTAGFRNRVRVTAERYAQVLAAEPEKHAYTERTEQIYTHLIQAIRDFQPAIRSEVRIAAVDDSRERKPRKTPQPENWMTRSEIIVETAELFGDLYLPEDLENWTRMNTMPAGAVRSLTAPRFQRDLDFLLEEASKLLAAARPSSGEWLERFPGSPLREQEKEVYLIGPELLRRYGPVLIALEQAASLTARFIVLAQNNAAAEELAVLVNPINGRLPKSRRLMIKTPEQVRGLLKADTLRGLGIGEVDAALLRKMIPDVLPLNGYELDAWISQMPGLTALVRQFRALAILAAAA